MRSAQTKTISVEAFVRVVALPDNAGRSLDQLESPVIEVVSNNYSSLVAIPNAPGRVVDVLPGFHRPPGDAFQEG